MKPIAIAALALCLAAPVAPAYGHGGGLNQDGCHRETATGGYHCHRGSSSGDPDWGAVAAVLGGLVATVLIIRWMERRKNPTAALLPASRTEPRLRYGVAYDDDAPSLRVMWRFG